jgi:uncharacterized protein (TIGR03083 family)
MDAATDRAGHLDSLEREGRLLAAAAREAGPDAAVPTCPGWTVRDLVLHQGEVHRWATIVIRDALPKPSAVPADHLGALPDDAHLIEWFETGHAGLLAALRAAPDDLDAFRFLADAPPAATFWARRQAHETEVHRVDAESALGTLTAIEPDRAADGIDELLTGFVPRPHMQLRADPPQTLAIVLTDHPGAWHLTIGDGPVVTTRGEAPADCTVRGTAADVHLALWNRRGTEALDITGDADVLHRFREQVQISWR